MIFIVDDALFGSGDDLWRYTFFYLALCFEHVVVVARGIDYDSMLVVDLERPLFDVWLESLPVAVKLCVEFVVGVQSACVSSNRGSLVRVVVSESGHVGCFDTVASLNLIRRPYKILLENSINDGGFLKAVVPDIHKKAFERCLADGVVDFSHGGGVSTLLQLIENMSEVERLRVGVVCDSDSLERDGYSQQVADLVAVCGRYGVYLHVLKRRAIENYIPISVLSLICDESSNGDLNSLFNAWCNFNAEQRHYFPMKKGFKSNSDSVNYSQNLYTAELRGSCMGGFGPKVAHKAFVDRCGEFTDSVMRDDGSLDEFDELFRCLFSRV